MAMVGLGAWARQAQLPKELTKHWAKNVKVPRGQKGQRFWASKTSNIIEYYSKSKDETQKMLSNVYRHLITMDGIEYPTLEHAYQAHKDDRW